MMIPNALIYAIFWIADNVQAVGTVVLAFIAGAILTKLLQPDGWRAFFD